MNNYKDTHREKALGYKVIVINLWLFLPTKLSH